MDIFFHLGKNSGSVQPWRALKRGLVLQIT
jgi:hypothetical protein